jgi:hypothetical protein
MGLFNTIKKLFIYREPLQGDQFELLEDASEKIGSPSQTQQTNTDEIINQNAILKGATDKQPKGKKSPLRVEEWNMERQQDPAALKADTTAQVDRFPRTSSRIGYESSRSSIYLPTGMPRYGIYA